MAITRGTLQIARRLRRDIGTEVDDAVRTLTTEWVNAWDGLASAWQAGADELVAVAVRLGRWPHPGEIMRLGDVDRAMRGTIAALDKLAERTETVAAAGADRVIQLDAEREARIVASQAPAAEELGLAQMLDTRIDRRQVEALREAWALREQDARTDVQLTVQSRIRTDAVNVITQRTGQQIHSSALPLSPQAVDSMRRELVRGVDVGANPREAAGRMVAGVQGQFNGGLSRAMNISRTEVLDAYRTTSQQIHSANADVVPGWSWLAQFDTRVCPSCLSLHGTQYPVSEPGPQDHQQGRCARLPVLASWAELGISVPEPPSAMPNAEEWFAGLSRTKQLQILGPARLQMLDEGLIGWGDLATLRQSTRWRPAYVPTPVRDLRRRVDRGLSPTPRAVPTPRPTPPAAPTRTFGERVETALGGPDALRAAPVGRGRGLSAEESSALEAYAMNTFRPINASLRAEPGAPWVRQVYPEVDALDAAMARSTIPQELLVYRGIHSGADVFGDAWNRNLTGAVWTEHGYLSTSANPYVSGGFSSEGGGFMNVLVPPGTRGVALPGVEDELLLQRGLRLRVLNDSGPGSTPRRLDVEVIP